MPLDQRVLDEILPQDTGESFPWLLEITHDSLSVPIRLTTSKGTYVSGFQNYVFSVTDDDGTREYFYCPFTVEPPSQGSPRAGKLVVWNVDQRIGRALRLCRTPPLVSLVCVLYNAPTVVVDGPFSDLLLRNVTVTAVVAEGDLLWEDITTIPWPSDRILPNKFKAVFLAL